MHNIRSQKLYRYLRGLLVGVCVLVATGSAAAEKIKIGWVYAMANTPVLVAYHNGYFKSAGVDVELRQFNSGPLLMRALKAGEMDIAYIGMPPVYHAVSRGQDIKIVAKVNHGQAALITHKDSPIKTLSDLRNRSIAGVRKGSGMDVLLKAFVIKEAAGLDARNDVRILHMPTKMMGASVHKKLVDAAFTWEPFVSMAVLTEDSRILLDMNKVVPKYPWYVIAANKMMMTSKREELYKVLAAHKRAVADLNSNPDSSSKLIIETFRLNNALEAIKSSVSAEAIVTEARGRLGWDNRFHPEDEQFLQRLMDYSFELGFLKKKLQVDNLIDREAVNWSHTN